MLFAQRWPRFFYFPVPAGCTRKRPPPPPAAQQPAPEPPKTPDADGNPFAPSPAPPLPPGMTGSDVNDPRYKLTPGLYDAGEASMGMKHLQLLKKPDAFQLGATDPDDPKVTKTIQQLGIGGGMKIPKSLQLVIAELAFANSDLAFQGNHLFQGNFYGVNIYDISNPAQTALLTSMVCPGGQGDVSVYKNLLFMSVEMPNGRLDCGTQGFPPEPPPRRQATKKNAARPQLRKIVSAACASSISRTSRIPSKSPQCRPAAVRTRIRWSSIPTTRTTFISTSPARPSCAKPKNSPAAPAKRQTKIRTLRCFALM